MRWALFAAGVVLIVVSLGADYAGVGEGTRFGYKQSIGAVVGAVLAIVGLANPKGS